MVIFESVQISKEGAGSVRGAEQLEAKPEGETHHFRENRDFFVRKIVFDFLPPKLAFSN